MTSILKSVLLGTALRAVAVHATEQEIAAVSPEDVKEYRGYFKLVHDRDTTLTHEDLVSLVLSTTDDMEPKDWAEVILNAEEEETETETDDRSLDDVDQTPGSAYSYAIRFDAAFEKDIDVLAEAALENKRGGAVIMNDLFRIFGEETVCNVWPQPGSEKGKVGDNEAYDKESTDITKVDGTTGKGTRSFYQDMVDLSAKGAQLLKEKTALKDKQGDVLHYKPKMAAIDGRRSNFKSVIVRAVNLAKKIAFVNSKTGMHAEIVMDTDDNNQPVVAKSNKVIFIKDDNNQTKFDVITIGQFLALKVSEGATYSAIVGTSQRATKAGTGPVAQNVKIETIPQFDDVSAEMATFFERLTNDAKASNAFLTHLNGAGTDDLLLSLNAIMLGIDGYLSKPGIDKRLKDLLAEGKQKAKAA